VQIQNQKNGTAPKYFYFSLKNNIVVGSSAGNSKKDVEESSRAGEKFTG
jgi:hypothetical protein